MYPRSSQLAVVVDTSCRMPASCGIRAVWTSVESRGQGIATKLLDTCRLGALPLELCKCISCPLKPPNSCHPLFFAGASCCSPKCAAVQQLPVSSMQLLPRGLAFALYQMICRKAGLSCVKQD